MRKGILAAAASLALAGQARAGDLKAATDAWQAALTKYVKPSGGVDYAALDKDPAALESVLKEYATLDLKSASDATKKAAYINLYNATMMYNLLKHAHAEKLDVAGKDFAALRINKIAVPGGNIWNGDYKVKLGPADVRLDDIEHGLIRGKESVDKLAGWQVSKLDPRIHAAVNCAAVSCPRVRETAYTAENVDQLLDENMREFLSTEAQFSKEGDKLRANQIVSWYYSDFDDYGQQVLKNGGAGDYLATFVKPDAKDHDWKVKHLKENFNDRSAAALKLSSAFDFHYDWRVNDVRNKK